MRKLFCDACNKEVSKLYYLEYLIHIDNIINKKYEAAYVNEEGNAISGRNTTTELCIVCYNQILTKTIKELHNIRSNYECRGDSSS